MYYSSGAALQAAINALPASKVGSFVAFDPFFYGQTYMKAYTGTLSPIEYFVQIGAARGDKPSATFDPVFYMNQYPADLAGKGYDAADLLMHFLKFGLDEGRLPNATLAANFDATAYLAAYPAVAAYVTANLASFNGSMSNGALAHYVKFGAAQGFAIPQSVFTLTPGVDAAVASSFVGSLSPYFYDGKGPTLNDGDALTGSGTTGNSLTVVDSYGAGTDILPKGMTLKNIQSVTLNTSGNAGQVSSLNAADANNGVFDTSPYASVTSTKIISNGGGTDAVQASNSSAINVAHSAVHGGVATYGGSAVTVNTQGNGGVLVTGFLNTSGTDQVLPNGAVLVNANGLLTGAGKVTVDGGAAVTVNVTGVTSTGNINIGNTGPGNIVTAAYNPTGAIVVNSVSMAGGETNADTIFGGSSVTVAVAGDTVVVGDANATTPTNNTTGNITVTDVTASTLTPVTGSVSVFGGANVLVTENLTGGVVVGSLKALPTGTVTVNANGKGAGAANVTVKGGTAVAVTVSQATAAGAINIGNTADATAGITANPTGAITVTSAATVGSANVDTIFGGTTVTVNVAGDTVAVGDASYVAAEASNEPSGAVVVNDLQATTYTNLTGAATKGGAVGVYGGSNVTVSTNTGGGVTVGSNATNKASGAIVVTDTSSDLNGAYAIGAYSSGPATSVFGGTSVVVTEAGGSVTSAASTGAVSITETKDSHQTVTVDGGVGVTVNAKGQTVSVGATTVTAGAQVVNQASVYTGLGIGNASNSVGSVTVDGGTTVTINTTGGNVAVGKAGTAGATYNATAHVSSGAVNITNTFSGAGTANASTAAVLGGSTVAITETNTTSGAISVGAVPVVASQVLTNSAAEPTGNVTINNSVTNGATTTYGTSGTTVYTNGATAVTITGAGTTTVLDAQTALTAGTSTLATVSLTGISGSAAITSNALTTLSLASEGQNVTVTDASAAGALALNLSGVTGGTVTDNGAVNALTVTTSGTVANTVGLAGTALTSATFNTTADVTVSGWSGASLATITAANTGKLALGDVTGLAALTSIVGTTATGAISAKLNPNNTAFAGGSANDTVTLSASLGASALTINAGTGANDVLVAAFTEDSTAIGSSAKVVGFETLAIPAVAGVTNHGVATSSGGTLGTSQFIWNPGSAAVKQMDTVTVGGTPSSGNTFAVHIGGGATVTYTAITGDTTATIAQYLSGLVNSVYGSTYTVTYTSGGSTFTVTGAVSGLTATPFTLTALEAGAGGTLGDAVTTTGVNGVAVDPYYDATGFANLVVQASPTGMINFNNVAAGATLSLNASVGTEVNYILASSTGLNDTLPLVVGVGGTTGTTGLTEWVATIGVENVTIASQGKSGVNNIQLTDSAIYGQAASGLKTITVTGDAAAFVNLADGTAGAGSDILESTGYSAVTTITAVGSSAAVDVSHIGLKNAAAHTITGGSGLLTAAGGTNTLDADTITTGSGGGSITVGAGGEWTTTTAKGAQNGITYNGTSSLGSEALNLSASTAVKDTIAAPAGVMSLQNAGVGGVTGFSIQATASSDVLNINGATHTALVNASSANVGTIDTLGLATGFDPSGALSAKFANLVYTSANGVITFAVTNGHSLSEFSNSDLMHAAEIIVDYAGQNVAATTQIAGNTYIIASNATLSGQTNVAASLGEVTTWANLAVTTGISHTFAIGDATGLGWTSAAFYVTVNGTTVPVTVTLTNGTTGTANTITASTATVATAIGAAITLAGISGLGAVTVSGSNVSAVGGNTIGFAPNGTTATATAVNALITTNDANTLVELLSVTGATGFGGVGSASTLTGNVGYAQLTPTNTGTPAAAVYSAIVPTVGGAWSNDAVTVGTTSTAITGQGASATLALTAATAAFGAVTSTQAAGSNIAVTISGAPTSGSLTLLGDWTATVTGAATLDSLNDTGATLTTLTIGTIGGVGAQVIKAIADTALTTITGTDGSSFTLGGTTALSQAGLKITLGAGNDTVNVSGDNDVIATGTGTDTVTATGAANKITLAGAGTVTANGAGDTITVTGAATLVTATGAADTITVGSGTVHADGAGDTIKVTTGSATVHAAGLADTFVLTDNAGTVLLDGSDVTAGVGIGNGSTVTFGTGTATVCITGDVGGTATAPNLILTNVAGTASVVLANTTTETLLGQVNVASAATLADALNLAAATAAMQGQTATGAAAGTIPAVTGLVDWFQFGGNTYIVEAVNGTAAAATHTALAASDVVIKIVGLVDLANIGSFSVSSNVLHFTTSV